MDEIRCIHRSSTDTCPYPAEFEVLMVTQDHDLDWAAVCSACLPIAVRLALVQPREHPARVTVRLATVPSSGPLRF